MSADQVIHAPVPSRAVVKFNLSNYIDTNIVLGRSLGLHPVYEAIANSLDAISESATRSKGRIVVRVVRKMDEKVQTDMQGGADNHPVSGFEIEDNGIGFTDKHYASFGEGSSDYKKQKGGKGLGRLSWLKVFTHADITSYFKVDGILYRRAFRFSLETAKGVKNHKISRCTDNQKSGTTVRLTGKRPKYECPKKSLTIARHIIEHNLAELLFNADVSVVLSDPDHDGGDIDLRDVLRDEYVAVSKDTVDKFVIEGYEFELRHALVKSSASNAKHRVMFCAKNRTVETHNLSNSATQLSGPITVDGVSRVYLGILTGSYFDEYVNSTRTAIALDEDSDSASITPVISLRKIIDAVREVVLRVLREPLNAVRHATQNRVSTLIKSDAPEYRGVLDRHPEILDRLSPASTDGDIISTVARERYVEHKAHLENINRIRSQASSTEHLESLERDSIERFYKGAHQEATECMVKFVHHRSAVLDLLNLYLGTTANDTREKEAAIHNLIFPMKNTSDVFPPTESNLWVLDERLVFHHYLASDMPFSEHDAIGSDSENRSDITIYNNPSSSFWDASFALTDQDINTSAVTIIEFKKPDRDNYTRTDNPYEQVRKYVLDIRDGKQEDRQGRRFPRPDQLRFFAYIALDVTAKLRAILKDYDFQEMVDGDGLFRVDSNIKLYVEVMSYQKMIDSARKRNAVYFKALNLPT